MKEVTIMGLKGEPCSVGSHGMRWFRSSTDVKEMRSHFRKGKTQHTGVFVGSVDGNMDRL